MNSLKHVSAIAAVALALAIVPTLAFGQNNDRSDNSAHPKNALVGSWEIAASNTYDCATGQPDGAPPTPINYTFNLGGTMTEIEANAIDGPYRSSAQGIWQHLSGNRYFAAFTNYSFNPDRTHAVTIKYRTYLTLSWDKQSFTERGTAEVRIPDGTVVANVCFADTGTRFTF